MPFTYQIPLLQETSISFQDSFEGKEPLKEIRGWIYQIITKKGAEWVDIQSNGGINVKTIDKYGKTTSEQISLKEIKLKDFLPAENPDWCPDFWNKDELQNIEIKIGDVLIEKLRNVFAITRYATIQLNKSLIDFESKRKDVLESDKSLHSEQLQTIKDQNEKYFNYPLEQYLHGIVLGPIIAKVKEHEQKILDAEFEKLYPEETKKKPIAGSRQK